MIAGTRASRHRSVGSCRERFSSTSGGGAMGKAILVDRVTVGLALIVVVVLVLVAIVLAQPLGGLGILGVAIWSAIAGLLAVGVLLVTRARRPLVGAGTIVMAASIWVAFFVQPQAWLLWTILFFVAVGLVVAGTRPDVHDRSWLVLLPRVVAGWAFVDN